MCYIEVDNLTERRELDQNIKRLFSSDLCLKLNTVKPESLVIVDKYATVNSLSSLVHTARQAMETIGRRTLCSCNLKYSLFSFLDKSYFM